MANQKRILCGKLFDGIKSELQENMEILVEQNRIVAVGRGLEHDADCETIDLTHLTVTPGLIDAHVHAEIMDWTRPVWNGMLPSNVWHGLGIIHTAQKALRRGFTTLRIPGSLGTGYYMGDCKRALDCNYFEGSRINYAYTCGSTAGHFDLFQKYNVNPDVVLSMQEKNRFIGDGPDFFRHAVREQKKFGSSFVKIIGTGGFSTPLDGPEEKQLSDIELRAIIDTAHELGLPVTSHAYTSELVSNMVNMGIDGIEHGAMIDQATIRLMEEKGTYLVPTFCPYEEIIHLDEAAIDKKPVAMAKKLRTYSKQLAQTRQLIAKSNLKLGYGTDFIAVYQAYDCGFEYMAWLNSNIDPFRALKAATSINAEILRMPEIGSLEAGKLADISGWSRDLLTDPKALLDCGFVMKDGVQYQTEKTDEQSYAPQEMF